MKKTFLALLCAIPMSIYAQNHALQYDGDDDYLRVITPSSIEEEESFTFEAQINLYADVSISDYPTIISSGEEDDEVQFGLNNNYELFLSINGETYTDNGYGSLYTGEESEEEPTCYWVAVTYDGEDIRFFVDGSEVSDFAHSFAHTIANGNHYNVGRNMVTPSSTYFNGVIDEVRVWAVARTETEITNNLEPINSPSTTDMLFYLPFREASGQFVGHGDFPFLKGILGYTLKAAENEDPTWVVNGCIEASEPEGSVLHRIGSGITSCTNTDPCNLICNGNMETYDAVLNTTSFFSVWGHTLLPWPFNATASDVANVYTQLEGFFTTSFFVRGAVFSNFGYNSVISSPTGGPTKQAPESDGVGGIPANCARVFVDQETSGVETWDANSNNKAYAVLINTRGDANGDGTSSSFMAPHSAPLIFGISSLTASASYTVSFYAYAGQHPESTFTGTQEYFTLTLRDQSAPATRHVIGSQVHSIPYASTYAGNGWYHFSYTFTSPSSGIANYDELEIKLTNVNINGTNLNTPLQWDYNLGVPELNVNYEMSAVYVDEFELTKNPSLSSFPAKIAYDTDAGELNDFFNRDIKTDNEGHIIIAGSYSGDDIDFYSAGSISTSSTGGGMYLAKYESGCATTTPWQVAYEGLHFGSIEVSQAGDIYAVGSVESIDYSKVSAYSGFVAGNNYNTIGSTTAAFVAKFDGTDGSIDYIVLYGGVGANQAYDLVLDERTGVNQILFTHETENSGSFYFNTSGSATSTGVKSHLLVANMSNGLPASISPQSQRSLGIKKPYEVAADFSISDDVYILGNSLTSGSGNLIMKKLTSDGSTLSTTIGTNVASYADEEEVYLTDMEINTNGYVIFCGYYRDDLTIGSSNHDNDPPCGPLPRPCPDYGNWRYHGFMAKYNSAISYINSIEDDTYQFMDLEIDDDNNILLAGFNHGLLNNVIAPSYNAIIKYNTSFSQVWVNNTANGAVNQFPDLLSSFDRISCAIAPLKINGKYMYFGNVNDMAGNGVSVKFDNILATTFPSVLGGSYSFIMYFTDEGSTADFKTSTETKSEEVTSLEGDYTTVYPNPTKGILNLDFSEIPRSVVVYDLLGRVIYSKEMKVNSSPTLTIDLSGYKTGMYFVKINYTTSTESHKIILE